MEGPGSRQGPLELNISSNLGMTRGCILNFFLDFRCCLSDTIDKTVRGRQTWPCDNLDAHVSDCSSTEEVGHLASLGLEEGMGEDV